jgi:hypothetical protein
MCVVGMSEEEPMDELMISSIEGPPVDGFVDASAKKGYKH